MSTLSVNMKALPLVEELLEKGFEYGLKVEKMPNGATLLDAGIEAKGGYMAGSIITEICLGGLGRASFMPVQYGDITLPCALVKTDHPAIATLGSQFAGWRIKLGDYFAMGSGPGRALALEPKSLYDRIGYRDSSDVVILVLETERKPPEEVIGYIAQKCGVSPKGLYVILTPTSSLAGSFQISGRIVETGVHKMVELGFDPKRILSGWGYAPIAPIHPKFPRAMGRTNDAILYGGVTGLTVDTDDDEALKDLVVRIPSSASRDYGKPFYEIFKAAGFDFYKIDPNIFAPAVVIVNNIRTGNVYRAGSANIEVLERSMGLV
ncbi:MAG: methenyltetrahydromethanopterin cyclohydrolase [Candidatus Bathyarchaeia archaeon]